MLEPPRYLHLNTQISEKKRDGGEIGLTWGNCSLGGGDFQGRGKVQAGKITGMNRDGVIGGEAGSWW